MDYDDIDFQGQNLHLAGEGSSKISPVLYSYAIPKFDFDDTFQGHLRFDNLVENEVFLGIPSSEDNQWIEDFSRGSSRVDFSSRAAESSILRHNNVWSEATSSESVEMLLKSVGQEEMTPGETIIEEPDAFDELGSITKQMEHNSNQDHGKKDFMDSHHALQLNERLESVSEFNENAGGDFRVECTSQIQEAKLSINGRSSELDACAVSENFGLYVAANLEIDRQYDENQSIVDTSVKLSPGVKMQEDSFMPIDNISSLDKVASGMVLNIEEMPLQVSDISVENPSGVPKDDDGVEGNNVVSTEANMDDQNLKGPSAETGTSNLGSLTVSSVEPIIRHTFETPINFEEPPNLTRKKDDDLQNGERCSENACNSDHSLGSKCEVTEINQESEANRLEVSPIDSIGDSKLKGHATEVCNSEAGVCDDSVRGSSLQFPQGNSSSVEKEQNFSVIRCQLDVKASVSSPEEFSFSGTCDKLADDMGAGSRNNHLGVFSNLTTTCSSVEILGENHAIENIGGSDASGIKEDSDSGDHVFPSVVYRTEKICEGDSISREGCIFHDRNVSFDAKGTAGVLSDYSGSEYETVRPPCSNKGVESSSLDGLKEKDMIDHGSKCEASTSNEPASEIALDSTNLVAHNILDGVTLFSGGAVTADEVADHSEGRKSPSLLGVFGNLEKEVETKNKDNTEERKSPAPLGVFGNLEKEEETKNKDHTEKRKSPAPLGVFGNIDKEEETNNKVSTEACLTTVNICLDGAIEIGSISGAEEGLSNDDAGQLTRETVNQSLPVVENCNGASPSEEVGMSKDLREACKDVEVSPIVSDLTGKDGCVEEMVVLENHEDGIIEKNHKMSFSEAGGQGVSKSKFPREFIPVSLIETFSNLGQNEQESGEAIAVSGSNDCVQNVQSTEVGTSNDQQNSCNPSHVSESDSPSAFEGGGRSSTDSDKANCGSPTIIRSTGPSQSEENRQVEAISSVDTCISVSEVADGDASKVQSSPQNLRENNATRDVMNFTLMVTPPADFAQRGTSKDQQAFLPVEPCKLTALMEGSPSTIVRQIDPKTAPEISRTRPTVANEGKSRGGSKDTPEGRKTRRVSGKGTGKDNAKKGNHVKEITPAKHSERGDEAFSVSMSPSGASQLVQLDGLHGNVELGGTKPRGVISARTPSLLDLNSSTPPSVMFQQPFTDLQQVQLRAQIFVYGSLIQGVPPNEACMISAFGNSDGGRTVWEPAWRLFIERTQGQKSSPNCETPLPSLSGACAADQAIKQGLSQNKATPSPVGRASSKNSTSVINSVVPISSPLWNMPSSFDGLPSSGMARSPRPDFHQAQSPLNPYRTPPTINFVGHNASWLSQAHYPGTWVASPQTPSFDASGRFSMIPIAESVKLTPIKESSLAISSGTKHVSSSPGVLRGVSSALAGTCSRIDMKKMAQSSVQQSVDSKSRKRKKVPVSEDLGHISLPAQNYIESVSAPVITSQISAPVVVSEPACIASKSKGSKVVTTVLPTSSIGNLNNGDQNAEMNALIAEESFSKVEEALLQAEDASALATTAVGYCQTVWSQLGKNSGLTSDIEVKLASAACAIAAAAAVAKAAAAAAKIASNAALQAKLMADEALGSSGSGSSHITPVPPSDISQLGAATPASLKVGGSSLSTSIIVAAKETVRRRVEAASAASKHAENLDAIVKAAELAAEAVSQAGKIVSMGDPLPLSVLVKAGPESYWKLPEVQGLKLADVNDEQFTMDRVEEDLSTSVKRTKDVSMSKMETQVTNHSMTPLSREFSKDAIEDARMVDGISECAKSTKNELRETMGRRVSDLAKTIGVVPESEVAPPYASVYVQDDKAETSKENAIKEGSLIEVFRDGDDTKAAWFSANILSLKDGNAFVCYTELQSDDGSGNLKESVALESESNKAPRVRMAHPITIMRFEGTRKRQRAAMGDYAWSIGDRVDAWIQNSWREGVVMEKNTKDETTVSVRFPAEGETSLVRTWHLRPTLFWNDGEWIEWSGTRERDCVSQSERRELKRFRLRSPTVEIEEKKIPKNVESVEESLALPLSVNERVFDVGKPTRDENKPDAARRMMRSGLQKEGAKVIFGVPKPGKKRKFMEVSKHYVADRRKNNESADSTKPTKYLMPQISGPRGLRNNPKIDYREKQVDESKSMLVKPGKSVSDRTLPPQKDKPSTSLMATPNNSTGQQNLAESRSVSSSVAAPEGPNLSSSSAVPSDARKKLPAVNAKPERLGRGKLAPSGGRATNKPELKDKVHHGNPGKSIPEVTEPRRSNRRIQPTSRLLEGLQSSLIVSKIPTPSQDRGHKSQSSSSSRSTTSKGNNHHG